MNDATDSPARRQRLRPPALLFGVPVADITIDETVTLIGEFVDEGRRLGRTHQISTVNVDFLVNALRSPEVASILKRSNLCIPDGMPVVWAARALGMRLRQRVAGADLVPRLVEASAVTGWRVHVFGSTPEVASAAERLLSERYPGASFSIDPGPMLTDPEHVDEDVLESIRSVGADVLCVAFGNPKQERFIAAHSERLGVPVMIGVGGSLDMLVGRRRRAPKWMRAIGLEWMVRALQEPRRLGTRYARDFRVFLPAVAHSWRSSRRRRTSAGLVMSWCDEHLVASLSGTRVLTRDAWSAFAEQLLDGTPLVVNAADRAAREPALAQLVGLVDAAQRGGTSVQWDVPDRTLLGWERHIGLDGGLWASGRQ